MTDDANGLPQLRKLLEERSVRKGTFTLASGRESDFFVDCKQSVLSARGHAWVGEALLDEVHKLGLIGAVAGVELGGCSLASAVSLLSFQRGCPVDAIYVRKHIKDHGSQRELEGAEHLPAGTNIAVLEDVVTTGGSTLRAVARLRSHGLVVAGVVAVIDRQEGGAQSLEDAGLRFSALYTRSDFLSS